MTRSLTDTPATLRSSTERARGVGRLALLVVGDAVSFLAFAGLGRHTHGEASGLMALGQIVTTAVPFALAWFLVAPWVGAFRARRTDTLRHMLTVTELSWVVAWPVALVLRWGLAADHTVPVSFAIVILVANAVFLGGWRTVFSLVERRVR